MADTLTPAQALAVRRPGGPILVAAAAGSGKTKVIVERLMGQILRTDEACSINDFLIITFTKKAAAELRARIARELAARLAEEPDNRHLQKQQSRVYLTQISTVHAFCAELIREFACELDVPADFRLLEETEGAALQARLADELLEERYAGIAEDPALRQLVDGLGAGRDDSRIPELILGVYETARCNLAPDRWLDACEAGLELTGVTGAEQTPWGASLLEGLRACAGEEAAVLEGALAELAPDESLTKYAPVFRANAQGLRALAACRTWDETLTALPAATAFGSLPPVRSCDDPALKERVKELRAQALKRVRGWAVELYGDSAAVLADLAQTADSLRALFDLTRAFAARFGAEKRRLHALDFADLEQLALRLLLEPDGETPTPVARRVAERYREILVDEYQDTNRIQDAIFRAVSRDGRNRFMVGDVKQSIYRFRLADPTIFLEKYAAYPDAGTADPAGRQRILLSHNFRSGEPILEAVNAVFRCCMSPRVGGLDYGEEEALRPGRALEPLPQTQVELHCLSTRTAAPDDETPDKALAEAAYAARRIRALLDAGTPVRAAEGLRPVEPGDIVILLRSPKNVTGAYLEALEREGIPAAADQGESVLAAAETQALVCLLRVLDNAHRDIPLTGALLSPLFGVPAAALARARQAGRSLDLWDAVNAAAPSEPTLAASVAKIDALRALAQTLPLHALLEKVQQATDLEAVCGAMDRGPARLRNLRAFFELAAAYAEGGVKSLRQLLTYLDELEAQGGFSAAQPQTNAVKILSVHKSKGLEFPVVFLCDLSHGFSTEDAKRPVQFHSRLGAGCAVYDKPTHTRFSSIARSAINRETKAENLSEELRILYVAMTRTRDMLIMTCCAEDMESRLRSMALNLSPATARTLAARATCLGDWVLLTALLRAEAGALHAVGGRPEGVAASAIPWRIEWQELTAPTHRLGYEPEAEPPAPPLDAEALRESLAFRYPHAPAQGVPSKLTATQLKGRDLDREADDGAPRAEPLPRKLRKPSLLRTEKPLTPAQRGTAVHQAMQYLDFSRTASLDEIRAELTRMVDEAFLTPAQAAAVEPEKLLRVFRGPLGDLIRGADRVLREFKFSLLTSAAQWYPEAADEQLLLQGVTDCCLFQDGALTVVDFKTDRLAPGQEQTAGEKYRPQLEAYAQALSRIFGLPVSKMYLYFFATDSLTEVKK